MLRIKSEILKGRQQRMLQAQSDPQRRRHILELFLVLLCLVALNVVAMMIFEGLNASDAAWLTLTTVTTVGYGDLAATTPGGRIATVLLLYLFGIFFLAQIIGEWIDYRFDRRDRMRRGLWRWKMKNHILILNTPDSHGDRYLRMLVEQVRDTPMLHDCPIQVFSPHFPDGLSSEIASMGAVLRAGSPEGRMDLAESDIESARFIILLAVDVNDPRSDSINLDLLDQLNEYDLKGHVISECVLESNRERFKKHGADAVIRPIRAYPELLVRAMSAPGTESILEDLFVHSGNHPRRYDVEFEQRSWGELASLMLQRGLGTPLGYMDADDRIITNPPPGAKVSGRAIFMMVNQHAEHQPDVVAECIAATGP